MSDALGRLRQVLPDAWSPATNRHWTSGNPARGACSVTALVAQDLLGGEILKTRVGADWHFYNRIGSLRVDLTEAQFEAPVTYDDVPSNREEAMADTAPARYAALCDAVAGCWNRASS